MNRFAEDFGLFGDVVWIILAFAAVSMKSWLLLAYLMTAVSRNLRFCKEEVICGGRFES